MLLLVPLKQLLPLASPLFWIYPKFHPFFFLCVIDIFHHCLIQSDIYHIYMTCFYVLSTHLFLLFFVPHITFYCKVDHHFNRQALLDSHVRLSAALWTVAPSLLCLGFSRQEYWSGLPFPSPTSVDLP